MPKYTARVFILNSGKFKEEIWFEGIKAKSQTYAMSITGQQAINYIALQEQHGVNKDIKYGYKIELCCRTSILDTKDKLAKASANANVLLAPTKNNKKKTTQIPVQIIMKEKFGVEERGDFKDPFTFAEKISMSILYPTTTGYYDDWY